MSIVQIEKFFDDIPKELSSEEIIQHVEKHTQFLFNQPLLFKTVCAKFFVSQVDEELHYHLVRFGPTHQHNADEFLPVMTKLGTNAFFLAISIRLFKTLKHAPLVRYLTLKYMCEQSGFIKKNYLNLNGETSFAETLSNCAYNGTPDYVTIYCASKALCIDIYLTTLPYNGFAELEFLKMPRAFSGGENSRASVCIGKVASEEPTKMGERFVRDHFAPLITTGQKDATIEWPNHLMRYRANSFYKIAHKFKYPSRKSVALSQNDNKNEVSIIGGDELGGDDIGVDDVDGDDLGGDDIGGDIVGGGEVANLIPVVQNSPSTFSFQIDLKKSSLNKTQLNSTLPLPRLFSDQKETVKIDSVPRYSQPSLLSLLAKHGSTFEYKRKINPKYAMSLILYCKSPLSLDDILECELSNKVFILRNDFDHKMLGCRWNHCNSKSYNFMCKHHKKTNIYRLKHYDKEKTHIYSDATVTLSHYRYKANCGNDFKLTVYFNDEMKILHFLGEKPNCGCRKLLKQLKAFESNMTLTPTEIFLKYPTLFKDRQEISNIKRKYMVKNDPTQLKKMKKN